MCSELFKENLKQTIMSDKLLSLVSWTYTTSFSEALSLTFHTIMCSELFMENLKQTIMSDKQTN